MVLGELDLSQNSVLGHLIFAFAGLNDFVYAKASVWIDRRAVIQAA